VHKPIGRGRLLGLAPLGPFAGSAEINEVAHVMLGGNQIGGLAILACLVWNNYADTVTLDHATDKSRARASGCGRECGYTGCVGQDTVA